MLTGIQAKWSLAGGFANPPPLGSLETAKQATAGAPRTVLQVCMSSHRKCSKCSSRRADQIKCRMI